MSDSGVASVGEVLDGQEMLTALGVLDPALESSGADVPESGLDEFAPGAAQSPVVSGVVAVPPEFVCGTAILLGMVEQVMLAVPSKDFYPSLKSILVDVTDTLLTLTGSNSISTVVSSSLAVRVTRPGRVLVPGAKFAAVVRLCSGPDVRVAVTDSAVRVASGGRAWTLRASSTQEYPPLPDLGDLSWFDVSRASFDRAVSGVRYAAGSDPQQDQFMQVELSVGSAVASDGLRFAQVTVELPPELFVQMATSGVDLVSRMLANNDADQFRIADGSYHTVVEIGSPEAPDRAIVAHLMRPLPPDARNALAVPRAANRDRCVVGASELLAALSAARPTLDSETGAVLLRVSPTELIVESRNRYDDSSTETIECVFDTPGSDRAPKPRVLTLVRDHLAKAVRAVQRGSLAVADSDEEPSGAEVVLLLGEDRSRARPAAVLIQDVTGTTQAVLTQVRSEWLS